LPIFFFALDSKAFGCGSCRYDKRLCFDHFVSYEDLEWFFAQIHFVHGFGLYPCSHIDSLLPHIHHELDPIDSLGKAWKVLDKRRGRKLSACCDAACHKSLKHERLQVGSGCIDRRSMSGWSRSYDDYFLHESDKLIKCLWFDVYVFPVFFQHHISLLFFDNTIDFCIVSVLYILYSLDESRLSQKYQKMTACRYVI
jgi:hypothetical protein